MGLGLNSGSHWGGRESLLQNLQTDFSEWGLGMAGQLAGSVAAFLRTVTGADGGPADPLRGSVGSCWDQDRALQHQASLSGDSCYLRQRAADFCIWDSTSSPFHQKQLGTDPTILHCQRGWGGESSSAHSRLPVHCAPTAFSPRKSRGLQVGEEGMCGCGSSLISHVKLV